MSSWSGKKKEQDKQFLTSGTPREIVLDHGKKFDELSDYIYKEFPDGIRIPMSHYYDKLSEYYYKGRNLYPNQLITKHSFDLLSGREYHPAERYEVEDLTYEEYEKFFNRDLNHPAMRDCDWIINDIINNNYPKDFVEEYMRRNHIKIRKRKKYRKWGMLILSVQ